MQSLFDSLALRVGRGLPKPLVWIINVIWTGAFIVVIVTLFPPAQSWLEYLSPVPVPPFEAVLPAFALLSSLMMLHGSLVQRRADLTGKPLPERQLSLRSQKYAFLGAVAVGFAVFVGTVVVLDREAREVDARCETYAAEHQTRPDQVVACPFR